MPTEFSQWRKFLQPVVTGLVALMAAGVHWELDPNGYEATLEPDSP